MNNLGKNFKNKLLMVSQNIGVRPEDLLAVMAGESGINPSATNSISAKGLIQFLPSTLKGLGFSGKNFADLNGEQQLDWIEKHFKSFNFQFKSPAQLYLGNFLPIALYLPGIKQENPNTIILEKNPQTIDNPSNPKDPLSKRYADAGLKMTASFERKAFLANPAFAHGKDYMTYKDFQDQINKNKNLKSYKDAINALNIKESNVSENVESDKDELEEYLSGFKQKNNDDLDKYVSTYKIQPNQPNQNVQPPNYFESTLDELLKKTSVAISISTKNEITKLGFSKVLSNAIKNNLGYESDFDGNYLNIKILNSKDFELVKFISSETRKIFDKYGHSVETICIIKN